MASGNINYASVVEMLLYLGHTHPDILFATHQCARYNHSPKQSHEDALKRIGRYLKGTLTKGLILNPSMTINIDCYPDADFAGLWTRDDKQDPHDLGPLAAFRGSSEVNELAWLRLTSISGC